MNKIEGVKMTQEQKQKIADMQMLINLEREYSEVYGYTPTFEEFHNLYMQGELQLTDHAEDMIIRLAEEKKLYERLKQ